MIASPSADTDTERFFTVGTKTSPPRTSYRIVTHQGLLQAKPTKPCPQNGHCTWCDISLQGDECQYLHIQHRCDCFTQARIPARFESATVEALRITLQKTDTSPSITKATRWLIKWGHDQPLPQKGLLLTGTQGTGKSFAMAAIIRHLTLSYETQALFLDFQHFIRELKYCYHKKDNDYELFDNLRKNEVLVLDDVQPIRNSPWIREVLHTIIAQRYNDCSRTLLTTNLEMNGEFRQWTTMHTYSRLKHMCYWLPFNGPDRRMMEM